jgi:hypothetical protein
VTLSDMRLAVKSDRAEWVDPLTIVWHSTGLVVRLRPDLPGIPMQPPTVGDER